METVGVSLSATTMKSVRWAFNFGSWNPTLQDLTVAVSGIQPEEKERIGRFVFKKDAKAALAGRLLLRKYVNELCGIPYARIVFKRDDKGKPYLDDKETSSKVSFNISHQGHYAVLAGESDVTVGIDVMKLEYSGGSTVSEFFRLMARQFSRDEWLTIKSFPSDEEKLASFYRHWSLKESFVKAEGTGIGFDLQRISFKVNSPLVANKVVSDSEVIVDGLHKEDWTFEETLIDDDHCVAVALNEQRDSNVSNVNGIFKKLSAEDLLKKVETVTSRDEQFCKQFLSKDERP